MSKAAILFSMLVLGVTAVAAVTPVHAGTNTHGKKHTRHSHHAYAGPSFAGASAPVYAYPTEPICPAVGRSFDCKIWPPPYADDPDRKTFRR